MKHIKIKGFTLIELMVVIAIIGLLSSVILASLGQTRLRAKDTAIKQIVGQMRAVMATQYAENPNSPSYFVSNPSWAIANTAGGVFTNSCATRLASPTFFSAQNATALIELCNQLATLVKQDTIANTLYVYIGATDWNNGTVGGSGHVAPCDVSGQCYTIMAKLPSSGTFYCVSGKVGTPTNSSSDGTPPSWLSAGCWDNP